MWQRWQQYFRRPIVWIPLAVSGLLNLGIWILLLVSIKPRSQLIVLHSTASFGVDRVGHWSQTLVIPAIGLAFIVCNAALAKVSDDRELVFAYFFLFLTPVLQLLLMAAAIFVVIANVQSTI